MKQEEIKTPAGKTSESNKGIIPIYNTDAKHLEDLRAAAIKYVLDGHPIVPMGYRKDGQDYKKPLIRWVEDGPLRTEADIEKVFAQLRGKIFGIATVVDGYTLVDFDTKDTPKLFKDLGLTPTVVTGKGWHMWYGADTALKQNGPVDLTEFEKRNGKKYQLEVYTSKRLDIIPPSKHHSGAVYEWVVPLEDFAYLPKLPESIATLCEKKERNNNEYLTKSVSEGRRHTMALKVAGYYARRFNGDISKIVQSTNDWNTQYCFPPLEDEEIEDITNWISNSFSESNGNVNKITKNKKLQTLLENDSSLTLFHDQDRLGYARIIVKDKGINVSIRSTEFKEYVRYRFFQETKESISNLQLDEVLSLCNAKAVYEHKQHSLYQRVAQIGGVFYYDLLNELGEVVKIDETGWSIISGTETPFLFKVGCGKEQVRPTKGGDLKSFLDLVTIGNKDEQMLYLCTLPVRLIREVDQAIAYIYGPAGSGKSTLVKITKDLLDPSTGGISMPINRVEDAIPLLSQSWVFANDNISKIDNELSDFFCIVATGAESSRRTLYTNGDITVFKLKNPVFLNGVNVEAYRSDLMSRMLLFKTEAFSTGTRGSTNVIQNKFQELKPALLGALFDTLSQAIRIKNELSLKTEFRMADFSLWGAACAEVLGYGAKNFEQAIQTAMKHSAYDAVYSLSAGRSILELLEKDGTFEGTATDLLRKLKDIDSNFDWHEDVAKSPASLGKKLRELENSFAELGISIDYGQRSGVERTIVIKRVIRIDDSNDSISVI